MTVLFPFHLALPDKLMALESTALSKPFAPDDRINEASDLKRHFIESARPGSEWEVGAEVELFGFTRASLERINPSQVQAVINGFAPRIINSENENGFVTEARLDDAARLTLEPGGQIEYSGAPIGSIAAVELALRRYQKQLSEIGEANRIIFVAAGFDPVRSIGEQHWIPKERYKIMRPYLGARGRRSWDMMCRTAAIQVNLDYSDTEDLAKKFALANRLGPVAAAIFANSPFEEGRLSGYKSTRYAAWLETDSDRTGVSPVALGDDFSIERFIEYAKTVPMFFIRRGGRYVDFTGRSFAEFISNGARPEPIFQDFTDHLSTIFTEARLKPHVEQRSMDCNRAEMVMAAIAYWKGLMYDRDALDSALRIAPKLNRTGYGALQLEVARRGLEAKLNNVSVINVAVESIEIARAGLKKIAPDEAHYLDALDERVIKERISPADILIRNFEGSWHRQIRRALDYLSSDFRF